MKRKRSRGFIRAVAFSVAAFAVVAGFAAYQTNLAGRYKNLMYANYERALSDVTQNVQQIKTGLESGLSSSSPVQMVSLAADVWRISGSAKSSLTNLPLSDFNIEKLQNYFSQTGDYLYVLAKSVVSGKPVGDKEKGDIQSLIGYSDNLYKSLTELNDQYSKQKATFKDVVDKKKLISFQKKLPDIGQMLSDGVGKLKGYPELTYDGVFSSNITTAKPIYAPTLKKVDKAAAKKVAAKFLKVSEGNLKAVGESDGKVPAYEFQTDSLTVSISKAGGLPLLLLSNKAGGAEKVSEAKALATARDSVSRAGFKNMDPVYTSKSKGILYVNFVYNDGGILCYPDLITVEVCLNSGTVCAFDSTGYLFFHKDKRNLTAPDIGKAQAKLSKGFTVQSASPAVILSDSDKELLTVDFDCTKDKQKYMVFINASTGAEEKILKLDGTEGGNFISS